MTIKISVCDITFYKNKQYNVNTSQRSSCVVLMEIDVKCVCMCIKMKK